MRKYIQIKEISELRYGDIVRHVGLNSCYVITHMMNDKAIGVDAVEITNPIEWEVLREEAKPS